MIGFVGAICRAGALGWVFLGAVVALGPVSFAQETPEAKACGVLVNATLETWDKGMPVGWSREPWSESVVEAVPGAGASFARVSREGGGIAILKQRILEGQSLAVGDLIQASASVRSSGPGEVVAAVFYVFAGETPTYQTIASAPHPNDGQFHDLTVTTPVFAAGQPVPDEIYVQVRSLDAVAPFEVQQACGQVLNAEGCGLIADPEVKQWDGYTPVFWSKEPWAETTLEHLDGSESGGGVIRLSRTEPGVGILKQQILQNVPLREGDMIQLRASVRAESPSETFLSVFFVYEGATPTYKTIHSRKHPGDGAFHELEVTTPPLAKGAVPPDQIFFHVRTTNAVQPVDLAHACGELLNLGL